MTGTTCGCRKREYPKKDYTDKYAAFYNSSKWQRVREIAKARYHYLDIYSLYIHKRIEQAHMVHHIEPLKESWNKRLDLNNPIPLTHSNPEQIEQRMK